jgi:mRNA interferase MazF
MKSGRDGRTNNVTANLHPKRGEVYWVDFEPARGVEQGGRRPVLVVQNDRGNLYSHYTVVVAISSAPLPRIYPFTVPIVQGAGNLPRAGHVNCSQLLTIDQSRLESLIGTLPPDIVLQVNAALRYELEL